MRVGLLDVIEPSFTRDGTARFDGIEVRRVKGMGWGVFATRNLPVYTALVYYGDTLTFKEYDAFEPYKDGRYVIHVRRNLYADAAPIGNEPIGHSGLFICGKLNEPRVGTKANCMFTGSDDPRNDDAVLVVTTCPIERGQELTVNYGSAYNRTYPCGKGYHAPSYDDIVRLKADIGKYIRTSPVNDMILRQLGARK